MNADSSITRVPWQDETVTPKDLEEMMSAPDPKQGVVPCPHGQTALTCPDCLAITGACPEEKT